MITADDGAPDLKRENTQGDLNITPCKGYFAVAPLTTGKGQNKRRNYQLKFID
jgi:hypothetical protein